MNIIEVNNRTQDLIQQLLKVWERSVRETHLFLSDAEIENIKKYVPEALKGVSLLIIANDEKDIPWHLWELKMVCWKCYLSHLNKEEKD